MSARFDSSVPSKEMAGEPQMSLLAVMCAAWVGMWLIGTGIFLSFWLLVAACVVWMWVLVAAVALVIAAAITIFWVLLVAGCVLCAGAALGTAGYFGYVAWVHVLGFPAPQNLATKGKEKAIEYYGKGKEMLMSLMQRFKKTDPSEEVKQMVK